MCVFFLKEYCQGNSSCSILEFFLERQTERFCDVDPCWSDPKLDCLGQRPATKYGLILLYYTNEFLDVFGVCRRICISISVVFCSKLMYWKLYIYIHTCNNMKVRRYTPSLSQPNHQTLLVWNMNPRSQAQQHSRKLLPKRSYGQWVCGVTGGQQGATYPWHVGGLSGMDKQWMITYHHLWITWLKGILES